MATVTVSIVIQAANAAEWTTLTAADGLVPRIETEVPSLGGTVVKNSSQRKATVTYPVPLPTVGG